MPLKWTACASQDMPSCREAHAGVKMEITTWLPLRMCSTRVESLCRAGLTLLMMESGLSFLSFWGRGLSFTRRSVPASPHVARTIRSLPKASTSSRPGPDDADVFRHFPQRDPEARPGLYEAPPWTSNFGSSSCVEACKPGATFGSASAGSAAPWTRPGTCKRLGLM